MAESTTAPERRRSAKGHATRERILIEGSRLFAVRGYFGTATRDIADAVGIKQPSLFFHFPTKQHIAEELLHYSLDRPSEVAKTLLGIDAPAVVRLYRYLHFDTDHLLHSPYDLSGVHGDDLMNTEEFHEWRIRAERLRRWIRKIISQAQSEGSVRALDVQLTQELISGMNLNTIRMAHANRRTPTTKVAQFVADFTLRALLSDVNQLEDVRAAALTVELEIHAC